MATDNSKKLVLDLIRLDGDTQSRESLNQEAIAEYTEVWEAAPKAENPFPAVDVFFDGTDYWAADGFHRIVAAKAAKRTSILVELHEGTAREALLFGANANRQHGVRRTVSDKRFITERFVRDEIYGKKSNRWIATEIGVSEGLVRIVRTELEDGVRNDEPGATVEGSDGRTYRAKKKKRKPKPPEAAAEEPVLTSDGQCPNCGHTKWSEDEHGKVCAKCQHPHGEPVGNEDAGEEGWKGQRTKARKDFERGLRSLDDLHELKPNLPLHGEVIDHTQKVMELLNKW